MPYNVRSSRKTTRRGGNTAPRQADGRKGLTADGSTRAWRRMRDALPGKPRRCPDGSKPFVNHKKSRRKGGKDVPGNLEWRCGHNPGTGRPKGT